MRIQISLAILLAVCGPNESLALSSPFNPANGKAAKQGLKPFGGGSGGRKSGAPDMPSLKNEDEEESDQRWEPSPPKPSEARLTVVQITDVYTLENFASLKTMLQETRAKLKEYRGDTNGDSNGKEKLPQTLTKSDTGVISMLTGDFFGALLAFQCGPW